MSLTQTGLLFADDLMTLRDGDCLVILAYGRVYPELSALLTEADRLGLKRLLLTDTLQTLLRDRFGLILSVPRGHADMLSMHTATLALLEALLVGVASSRPEETVRKLKALNTLREGLVGQSMNLPARAIGPRS